MTNSTLKTKLLFNLNNKHNKNLLQKGFTLVELMVVIVIVGILSAVALPNFLSQTSKAKATECTTRMGAILSQAGAEGLMTGTDAEKNSNMTTIVSQHDSDLCTFTSNGFANDIYSVSVTGATGSDLAGKYDAAGCVNPLTGVRKQAFSTDGTAPTAPVCAEEEEV